MPFTLGGDWYFPAKQYPPVKIYKEKRKGSFVTIVKHLPFEGEELKRFVSEIKKKLACGGSLKGDLLEIQGDKEQAVRDFLTSEKIKCAK